MPLTIEVKATDVAVRARGEDLAQNVVKQFGDNLPDSKLLAFFDDQDAQQIQQEYGSTNRGLFAPKPKKFIDLWPYYVRDRIFVSDPHSWTSKQAFDRVIYLHGSTCADQVGLVMTFSHELQHFVQYGFNRKLWAENYLLTLLPSELYELEHLNWPDIPNEREARIIAKRVATTICGDDAVDAYILHRIRDSSNEQDSEDWQFSRSVDASVPYDLAEGTKSIFRRLKSYRADVERVLAEMSHDADFKGIDLAEYFEDAVPLAGSN